MNLFYTFNMENENMRTHTKEEKRTVIERVIYDESSIHMMLNIITVTFLVVDESSAVIFFAH